MLKYSVHFISRISFISSSSLNDIFYWNFFIHFNFLVGWLLDGPTFLKASHHRRHLENFWYFPRKFRNIFNQGGEPHVPYVTKRSQEPKVSGVIHKWRLLKIEFLDPFLQSVTKYSYKKQCKEYPTAPDSRAYPEIFRGGFEFFLYGRESLGGVWNFFLKTLANWNFFTKKGGLTPKKPLNTFLSRHIPNLKVGRHLWTTHLNQF